jgi:hypothetical protein
MISSMMKARTLPTGSSRLVRAAVVISALLLSSQLALAQFTQQGPKLVGDGATGYAEQGWSVALSADGNTAIVGGLSDNSPPTAAGTGAAWVFTRSGTAWTQQGSKVVSTSENYAFTLDGNVTLIADFR